MKNSNKIIFGRVGHDLEIKYTTSGKAVCEFSLAENDGESTQWHKVILWEDLAEYGVVGIKKGDKVFVRGPIRKREYVSKDGEKKSIDELHAWDIATCPNISRKSNERS